MKTILRFFTILMVFVMMGYGSYAQDEQVSKLKIHKIIKQNGAAFVGTIVSEDAREILLNTEEVGMIYIPKHEIDEIIEIHEGEKFVTGGLFSTRYFLTTNGFSINKGDNYVQWNLFGPDFQFGVADNFTVGVMTSWAGMPIIGTTKYSTQISEKIFGGVGFLGGTGSWAFPKYGMALPFGFLSIGDRVNNVNLTAGYGFIFTETRRVYTLHSQPDHEGATNSFSHQDKVETQGRPMFSLAGMFRLNDKFSFVFDSFFMLAGKDMERQQIRSDQDPNNFKSTYRIVTVIVKSNPIVVLAPGLRFQATETSSFQFGFTGVHFEGEFVPVPIPLIQWFKRI